MKHSDNYKSITTLNFPNEQVFDAAFGEGRLYLCISYKDRSIPFEIFSIDTTVNDITHREHLECETVIDIAPMLGVGSGYSVLCSKRKGDYNVRTTYYEEKELKEKHKVREGFDHDIHDGMGVIVNRRSCKKGDPTSFEIIDSKHMKRYCFNQDQVQARNLNIFTANTGTSKAILSSEKIGSIILADLNKEVAENIIFEDSHNTRYPSFFGSDLYITVPTFDRGTNVYILEEDQLEIGKNRVKSRECIEIDANMGNIKSNWNGDYAIIFDQSNLVCINIKDRGIEFQRTIDNGMIKNAYLNSKRVFCSASEVGKEGSIYIFDLKSGRLDSEYPNSKIFGFGPMDLLLKKGDEVGSIKHGFL